MKNRATIVCCYNNKNLYAEMIDSLETQTEKVDVIAIDNTEGEFNSCSAAFNSVLDKIKTKFVIFSHQDILYNSNDSLSKILDYFEQIETYDIVGVVGRRSKSVERVGNIKQGREKKRAVTGKVNGMEECDTLDECFFGGFTKCFQCYPFSEILCNGWHMYAVERCLAALTRGNKVFVADADLTHISAGKIDHAYNVTFYRIGKEYKSKVKFLATTCEEAPTAFGLAELFFIKRELHVIKLNLLHSLGLS